MASAFIAICELILLVSVKDVDGRGKGKGFTYPSRNNGLLLSTHSFIYIHVRIRQFDYILSAGVTPNIPAFILLSDTVQSKCPKSRNG